MNPDVNDEKPKTSQAEPTPEPTIMDEAARMFKLLGKVIRITAEDISNLMILRMDQDMREHLDMLVEAGAAPDRPAAAATLMAAGIQAKRPLFEKINQTRAQITILEARMRSLVDG
jgi:hypothetical protein